MVITKINGLTVILCRSSNPVIDLRINVKAGSMNDPEKLPGLAHFVEHMIFQGTTLTSRDDMDAKISKLGVLGAGTAYDFTSYSFLTTRDSLESAIQVLLEMILNPVFNDRDVSKEAKVIINESYNYKDDLDTCFTDSVCSHFWGSSVCHDIVGKEFTISEITTEHVKTFHKSHYTYDNMFMSVVGNFDIRKVNRFLSKHIPQEVATDSIQRIGPTDIKLVGSPLFLKRSYFTQDIIGVFMGGENIFTNLSLGMDQLVFLKGFVGSSYSSIYRYFRSNRGLCYHISFFDIDLPSSSGVIIYLSGFNILAKKLHSLMDTALSEVSDKGFGQDLDGFKNEVRLDLLLQLQTSAGFADFFVDGYRFGTFLESKDLFSELSKVDNSRIREYAGLRCKKLSPLGFSNSIK